MTGAQHLRAGPICAELREGGLGAVTFDGVEVLRGLTHPVRNADWGTYLTTLLSEEVGPDSLTRQFACRDGVFMGRFHVALTPEALVAEVDITFPDAARINRAGFTLLHPIRGVAGSVLHLRHSGGGRTDTVFPALVSPGQPARDIAGLRHVVAGIEVDIAFDGDVFEMEDQRNWSDASFKTYCRPLSLPRPYDVAAGTVVRQRVTLALRAVGGRASVAAAAPTVAVRMPQVMLAHEPGLSDSAALAGFAGVPVQLRMERATPDADLRALAGVAALEIVFDDLPDLGALIALAQAAGLHPARVTALPRPYLKSHQPEGPWPAGAQPQHAYSLLRAGFPGALVGGGSLTNFTELNRCRPDPAAVDFVTFGNTAIVHAADDLSVWQTIEALPDILATARAIAGEKPLHLGLISIGMRCNPYGDRVAPNPDGLRLPMAMDDPRQPTGFAAAYAVAALAAAAQAGVESLALAMPDGPLGAKGPLAEVIRQAAAMAGRMAQIRQSDGVVVIEAGDLGLAANCTTGPLAAVPGLAPVPAESAVLFETRREARQ
ncbi:MAG: hypothetical protein C0427_04940 [Rhodobacter sp.]|nr:hypothetical protein [Rhodobacter sp.]